MIAWVDVETTGLETVGNSLLEVGLILTDDNLVEIDRWWAVIRQPPHILNIANPQVLAMHEKSGLLAECAASEVSNLQAQAYLSGALFAHAERPVMGGSTVGFDRAWLKAKMPHLESGFHYRSIDVSTLKELNARWGFAPEWDGDRDLHRSLPDLEDSIAELRHYRAALLKGPIAFEEERERRKTLFTHASDALDEWSQRAVIAENALEEILDRQPGEVGTRIPEIARRALAQIAALKKIP